VNDVTALMGKLKANVSYLQFADSASEDRANWPVLERMAQAQRLIEAESAAPAPTAESPGVAWSAPAQNLPAQNLPAQNLPAQNLPAKAALAPPPASPAPIPAAWAQPPAPKPGGSLLRRYKAPESARDGSRQLSDIFARLERKTP
jgi:hypothetical protein